MNAQQVASSYASIGYAADSTTFVSASINAGLALAPASLTVPSGSSYALANSLNSVASAVAFAL